MTKWVMAVVVVVGLAVAQDPGDYYPSSGTPEHSAGVSRVVTVYGSVNTNDVLVFMDRTGNRVRGTNLIEQVQGWAEEAVTNAVAVETAALSAYSNHVRTVYLRGVDIGGGVYQLYLGE